MRILKEDTLCLVIDIQERLFPFIAENEQLTNNVKRLIQGIRAMEVPLIVTEQYNKGLGFTLPEIKESCQNVPTFEKSAFSCCDDEHILKAILTTRKKNIILCGIESHICVQQTALDLIEKGFQPVVISDCVSSRKLSDKETAIMRMRKAGAIVTSYESILFELCRFAGTEQFKAISKIVK